MPPGSRHESAGEGFSGRDRCKDGRSKQDHRPHYRTFETCPPVRRGQNGHAGCSRPWHLSSQALLLDLNIAALLLVVVTAGGTLLIRRQLRGGQEGPSAGRRTPREPTAADDDLQALLAPYQHHKTVLGESVKPTVPVSAAAGRAVESNPGPVRFLEGSAKVLYFVLKAALPECHIFAYARLADVVRRVGRPLPSQSRAQLAQSRVDFVVCNKDLVLVALLDLSDGTRPDDPAKQQLHAHFAAAGIRYVRVAPNAIPKPQEVRSLVLGGYADFCPDSTQIRLRQLP